MFQLLEDTVQTEAATHGGQQDASCTQHGPAAVLQLGVDHPAHKEHTPANTLGPPVTSINTQPTAPAAKGPDFCVFLGVHLSTAQRDVLSLMHGCLLVHDAALPGVLLPVLLTT